MNIKDCLEKKYLAKIDIDPKLVQKELGESEYDIEKAQKALAEEDYKWTIVKAYYSMFHAAKSILLQIGYQEKRHIAVLIVLEELNRKGKLESRFINDFSAALYSRQEADYHYVYNKEIAKHSLEISTEFLGRMKKLINELKKK